MRVLMKLIAFHIGDKQGVRKMKVSELLGLGKSMGHGGEF